MNHFNPGFLFLYARPEDFVAAFGRDVIQATAPIFGHSMEATETVTGPGPNKWWEK